MLQHEDRHQDRQQDMQLAALTESNKALQITVDRLEQTIRDQRREDKDWQKRMEDTLSERAATSQRQREAQSERLAKIEARLENLPEKLPDRLSKVETENRLVKWVLGAVSTGLILALIESIADKV